MNNLWEVITPNEADWDIEPLNRLDPFITAKHPRLTSFLVSLDGRIVLERYYNEADEHTLHDLRSATKSFMSALVGIAIHEGVLPSVDVTLGEIWPDQQPPLDPLKAQVTVHELLTMTSGMHWMTGERLGERWIRRMHESKDWLRFILRLPVKEELQGNFLYRSPDSHLLSCLFTSLSGKTLSEYAEQTLFSSLGIKDYRWDHDPQGHSRGHIGLWLRARDMAAFGQCYLQQGIVDGEAIIPTPWIETTWLAHSQGLPRFGTYGYQWWSDRWSGQDVHMALGHGGQLIMVIPSAKLVAVTTGEPQVSRWRHPRLLMEQLIFPAARLSVR